MKGKLFRRHKYGYIYEVVEQDEISGTTPRWILWNERVADRIVVSVLELQRQVGWELVGNASLLKPLDPTTHEIPPALMK